MPCFVIEQTINNTVGNALNFLYFKMNERIRELASKALKQPDTDNDGLTVFDNDELAKFAELIIRECLSHGKLTQSQTVVNGSEEYNAGREMGIEVFMNRIKQHFGVEE